LKLLGKRIALVPCEEKKMTDSGIALPDIMDNSKDEGVVVAVGEGHLMDNGEFRPLGVHIGDKVKFAQYGAVAIEVEGRTVLIITEDDVLAITQEA
jgi:chaperonin GroES